MMLGLCRQLLNPSGAAAAAHPGRTRADLLVAFGLGDVGIEHGHGPELGGGRWWVLAGDPSSLPRGSSQSGHKPQIQGLALLLPLQIYPGDRDRSQVTPGQCSMMLGRSHHGLPPSWTLTVLIPAVHHSGGP